MDARSERLKLEIQHHLDDWSRELDQIPEVALFDDIRGHLKSWIAEGKALIANLEK